MENCFSVAVILQQWLLSHNDYFDFERNFSKKELLEYELGYSNLGHTTFCKVCRGCSDEVNPFHVEVAKQIENNGGIAYE